MTYISLLLIWKVFLGIALADVFAVVPLSLQLFLIALILIEHRWTKLVLKAWVIVFVLLAQSITIGAKLLASANGELEYITSAMFYFNIFQFLMGLLILLMARVFIRDLEY